MRGWRTGKRNRHTLAGVPTRPAKTEPCAQHGEMRKPRTKKGCGDAFCGRGLLRLLYRAAKPVSFDRRSVAVVFYLSNSRRCNKELSANPNNGEAAV